jgi:hypothetical protein
VVFLPPHDGNASTPAKVNGVSHSSAVHSSPSPEAVTPQHRSTATPVGATSRPESRPANASNVGEALDSAHNPATSSIQSTVSSAANTIANAIPTSSEDFKAQLANANATIASLKQQLEQGGLRQRKTNASNNEKADATGLQATIQQQAPGGVSVQIVAVLCLLSFLLAYFFF